jgi:SsrA-binding protein
MTEKKSDAAVTSNRKAYHDYFIEETYEAGMSLHGT